MYRQEMEEQIRLYIPRLVEDGKERWKNAEKVRNDFVKDFSLAKINAMQLDDFVIGKGSKNRSFCYRLERDTDDLGLIQGATAFKFGIYYGRTKNDPAVRYRFGNKWGSNPKDAFASVKTEIISLLDAAKRKDIDALNKNRLSTMFKGKILFIYHPAEYIPIYSQEHLKYFVAELNLHADPKSSVEMQRALISYRATWTDLTGHSAVLFMHLLYQIFPEVKKPLSSKKETPPLPLLDQAIEGARFIDHMPPISTPKVIPSTKGDFTPKIDYIEKQKQRKRIGNRGEAIVLSMEEKRLQDSGRSDLARKIQHVSDKSDREGYDILSYETDGSPRHIEVKATSNHNLDRGFFISLNELGKSEELPNYYIYLVFEATGVRPKILPVKNPKLRSEAFNLQAMTYHVTLNP